PCTVGSWRDGAIADRFGFLRCVSADHLHGAVFLLDQLADVVRDQSWNPDGGALAPCDDQPRTRVASHACEVGSRLAVRLLDSRGARLRLRELALASSPAALGYRARSRRLHCADVSGDRAARPDCGRVAEARGIFAGRSAFGVESPRLGGLMN